MHAENVTTPFGRRPMTLALLKGQLIATDPEQGSCVDKWKVFRDVAESRVLLGLSDRALAVLNALVSFYPAAQLGAGRSLVVFPSNEQLTLRAHGIAGTTLRRHLAALIDCGLITRKDSPNGKRYAHRDRSGKIEDAYGFSLAPLLARADELSQLAEQVLAERRALRVSKERLSVCRRDIRKLIATSMEEQLPGNWQSFQDRLDLVLARLSRNPVVAEIDAVYRECGALRTEICNLLQKQLNHEISATNDVQNERHLQNPNTYTNIEKVALEKTEEQPLALKPAPQLSLTTITRACPQIHDYAPRGHVESWQDLGAAAHVVRLILGVSTAAYESACRILGPQTAAATIACILERGPLINSAGGYLRDLTRRGQDGSFSLSPMLMALLRSRPGERNAGAQYS